MKFRDLFRDIVIYGTGDLILKASIFITMPIYTRIFTPDEYGVWSFVVTAVGFLSGILVLGGDSAYARYFFEAKTNEEKQVITSTWLGFLAVWSLVLIGLCLPWSGVFSRWSFGSPLYQTLFLITLLAAPLSLINTMCGQVLRNQFRARLFVGLNIAAMALSVGFSLAAILGFKLGLAGLVLGELLSQLVMLPVRLFTAREMFRWTFSGTRLRELLSYGVPLVPTSIAYWIFASSDRLILGKLSTLEQVGLYSIANSLTGILAFINNAVGKAWSPHAVRAYEESPETAPEFFGRMLKYILVGFGLLGVGLTVFAREILMIMSTPDFYPAALAVGPLTLGFFAYASTQVTATGISMTKKTRYFAWYSWLAAVLNLVLNLLLVPRWGMIAASWSTAVSYVFLTLAYYRTSQRLWPIAVEKRKILIVVGVTGSLTLALQMACQLGISLHLALKVLICAGYLGLLAFLKVIDEKDWKELALVFTAGKEPGRINR